MTERMTPERFADWTISDEAGELTWDEERPDSVAELWFALVAEREYVEASEAKLAAVEKCGVLRKRAIEEMLAVDDTLEFISYNQLQAAAKEKGDE